MTIEDTIKKELLKDVDITNDDLYKKCNVTTDSQKGMVRKRRSEILNSMSFQTLFQAKERSQKPKFGAFSFYLEAGSHQKLREFAKQQGFSTSNIVDTLIKNFLKDVK